MNPVLVAAFISVQQILGLPPGLLSAICYTESNHNVRAIALHDGGSDSLGECSIKYDTAYLLGYRGSLNRLWKDPKVNVLWAGKYLKMQLDRYDGDTEKAVAAYNSGTHCANKKGVTRNIRYVKKVMKAWRENK